MDETSDVTRGIRQRRAEGKHGLTGAPLTDGMLTNAPNYPAPLKIQAFLENASDARENGYELICAECGCGINDDSDDHDQRCSEEAHA